MIQNIKGYLISLCLEKAALSSSCWEEETTVIDKIMFSLVKWDKDDDTDDLDDIVDDNDDNIDD